MQGSNRAKLHIFFHLTTLKPNYYVFSEIKIVLYHIKTHICALRTHLRPNRKQKRLPTLVRQPLSIKNNFLDFFLTSRHSNHPYGTERQERQRHS